MLQRLCHQPRAFKYDAIAAKVNGEQVPLRTELLDAAASDEPVTAVHDLDGLRLVGELLAG